MKRCMCERKQKDLKIQKYQMLSTWTHPELCKPIWNQRKKSKRTFDGREREIERERERMRKKVEEIHVEDWKSKDCGSKDCGFN
jgi:hypothetical protein